MTSNELARRISHWTKLYNFCEPVKVRRADDSYSVEFEARTTKTRASSMVTRVELIAKGIASDVEFEAGKELLSEPPSDRASLATWRIYVRIPIHTTKRSKAA